MNQTIYFRKDVWDKFKDEAGKSNLINQLLAKHYGMNPREVTVDDRSPLIRPMSEVLGERTYAKAKTIAGIRVEPLVKPPKPTPPDYLQHEPLPKAPHRYYHTEWEEYVKWTPEEGITQP